MPADVIARQTEAYAAADNYIAGLNVYMHHVLTPDGARLFPAGMRLLSHWNLRDELKARYSDPDGLARQQLIALVMEKIVRQEIPAAVVDNPLARLDARDRRRRRLAREGRRAARGREPQAVDRARGRALPPLARHLRRRAPRRRPHPGQPDA